MEALLGYLGKFATPPSASQVTNAIDSALALSFDGKTVTITIGGGDYTGIIPSGDFDPSSGGVTDLSGNPLSDIFDEGDIGESW